MKRLVLVFLFIVQSSLCFAGNLDEKMGEGFVDGDTFSRTVLQKTAQEIDYNQEIKLYQVLEDEEWVDNIMLTILYDDRGNVIESLQKEWINDGWSNSEKAAYTYNDQNNMTDAAILSWKDNEWLNSRIMSSTIDEHGNIIEQLNQSWEDGEWSNMQNSINTYDKLGNLSEILVQNWRNGKWEDYVQVVYMYDELGKMIEALQGVHNQNNEIIVSKTIYAYDDQGLATESINYSYLQEEDEFVNSMKRTYTYDDQGNMTEFAILFWQDGGWGGSIVLTYTYDEQGRLTESMNQSIIDGERTDMRRTLSSYDTITHIAENAAVTPSEILLTANYPNPFNLSTTINFSLPEAGRAELVIFNVMGQKVRNLLSGEISPGEHFAVWDGCDDSGNAVTTGVYFSRLRTQNSTASGRMLLVK
jgi:hypothetical protein